MTETAEKTCYRHPDRVTGLSCSECGRPICTECMTVAPVGIRCPEHSGKPQGMQRVTTGARRASFEGVGARVTRALIGINVAVYIAELLQEKLLRRRPVRRVLDLCTGSGCLAILAARAFPGAKVDAVDVSPAALAVARKNVARHRLGRRVRLQRSDLFDGLGAARYDLILSNPPYVGARAMAALPAELRHEPRLALAGGGDGLALVARILTLAPAHLEPEGLLVCEVGDARAAVQRRFRALKLAWPRPEVLIAVRDALAAPASEGAGARARSNPSPARR